MYGEKQKFNSQRIITDTSVYKLHYFHGEKVTGTPVFVIPPHAGRHGNITQRLIDRCVKQGRPVYAYELKSATQETKSTSIQDLVRILHTCCLYIGEPVDLIGVCQGAWLGALFTARFQDMVKRYVNFVGPINTKTGQENSIEKYMQTPGIIEQHTEIVYRDKCIQKGMNQWFAFSMIDPWETYIGRWCTYAQNLFFNKREAITKWENNESWYDDRQDLAGVWFLQCLAWHFKENRIYNGTFPEILGGDVNLKNITCDVYLFAGGTDLITHHQQVTDMANVVSSKEVYTHIFPNAGHTKAFVGTEELNHFINVFFKGEN